MFLNSLKHLVLSILVLFVFSTAFTNAQGVIYGIVRVNGYVYNEQTGAPMAGIQVRGCDSDGCYNETTDSNGYYDFGLGLSGDDIDSVEISLVSRYIYGYSTELRMRDNLCTDFTGLPSRISTPREKYSFFWGNTMHTGLCLTMLGGPIPVSSMNLWADDYTVPNGASTIIHWTTSNMSNCWARDDWSGFKADNGNESTGVLSGPATYTYTLRCYDINNNPVDRSISIDVIQINPSVDIRANGSNGPINILYGDSASLSWSSSDADTCTASGSWSGSKSTSGSQSTGSLTASFSTFNITCRNNTSGTSASDSVRINTTNSNPTGTFTQASCETGQVVVSGSAYDPDGGGPVNLRIYLDYPSGLVTETVNNSPSSNRFTFSYDRIVGSHNVRVYAQDNQTSAWQQIGGQLSYMCYEPITITDTCPECGDPEINFTFEAVPGGCS